MDEAKVRENVREVAYWFYHLAHFGSKSAEHKVCFCAECRANMEDALDDLAKLVGENLDKWRVGLPRCR